MLSGGEALSKIFAFLAFAYLARLLGPDTFGDIEFALAVTLFFNLIVEGGLGILGAREIAKDEKSVLSLTFHVVIIRCFLAVGAFLLLLVFAVISQKSEQEKHLVILYGLTLFGTPGLLQWVFQGLDRMQWVAISTVIRWSFFAGFVFLFIFDPKQVWVVPLIELGVIGCVVVFNFGVFRYFFGPLWQRFDFSFCLFLLRQAIPIGLTQVTWGLRAYLPIIMLGLMVGGETVGWFGAAHRIVIALHAFVWMYFFNLYPSISRCTKQPPEALQILVGKSIQVTAWVGVFIGATGTLLAGPVMNIVYGSQFDTAANGFKVLIWLISFILISGHYMYTLFAFNKQWFEFITAICGAIIIILLNLLIIPRYGFLGAAWTLLCSEAFIWCLNYWFVRRTISIIRFFPHLIKPIIAAAIMTAVLKYIALPNFWLACAAATILYGLGLLILQPSMIRDVRSLLNGTP
jgi:O-antigen/teichoic acid export membrane protein